MGERDRVGGNVCFNAREFLKVSNEFLRCWRLISDANRPLLLISSIFGSSKDYLQLSNILSVKFKKKKRENVEFVPIYLFIETVSMILT